MEQATKLSPYIHIHRKKCRYGPGSGSLTELTFLVLKLSEKLQN